MTCQSASAGQGAERTYLGIYKVKPEVVRTRLANDLPTIMHEVGHHLNKLMLGGAGDLNTKPLGKFAAELKPLATPGKPLAEGFAEFTRLYLTDPNAAREKAPKFHKEFKRMVSAFPAVDKLLTETRESIRRYIEQPASARVSAHISTEAPTAPPLTFDRIYTNTLDFLHPVKQVVEIMNKKKGSEISAEKDAYKLMRLLAGLAGKADEFVTHETFDAKALEANGKGFKNIIKPVEKAGLVQDFRILLVAKRAVELHERGIETGISLKDAKKAIQEVETPLLQKSAKEMYGYSDRLLRYAVDSGLLSEEDYSRIAGKNKNYVPYQRVQDEAGAGGKKTGSAGGPLIVGIKGSARQIIDPLEQTLKLSYNIIRESRPQYRKCGTD